jgi:predicted ferric reductase
MPHDAALPAAVSCAAAANAPRGASLRVKRALLLCAYVALVCGPLVAALLLDLQPDDPLSRRIGRLLPLLGVPILALQPVLAARFKSADRAFGLDVVYIFHKTMAMAAGAVLLAHPFLLASDGNWDLLSSLDLPWPILCGKAALLALVALIATSVLQGPLRLRYEQWRMTHNLLAVTVLALAFVHGLRVGTDLSNALMRTAWLALAVLAAASYVWHKAVGPHCRRKRLFSVTEVIRESHNVWTLKMKPPEGASPFGFLPGQFQFITFYAMTRRSEEHPFTISSSPCGDGAHAATIKESGDFTAMIGNVKPGDRVGVQAPFGRFSYLLHPEESDLVFLAGGIGITPFVSMLRHMRDTGTDLSVTLLYANRSERDIVFRDEIEGLAAGSRPRLKVVHVLDEAPPEWRGERGRVDLEKIVRHVGDLTAGKVFYLCGPPAMMSGLMAELFRAGVRSSKVRAERFAL